MFNSNYNSFVLGAGSLFFVIIIVIISMWMIRFKKNETYTFLGWIVVILVVAFNPITVDYLAKNFYSEGRIQRLSWGMPFLEIIVVAIVELIYIKKKKVIEWIFFLSIVTVILGTCRYCLPLGEYGGNLYVTKPECISVSKILEKENNKEPFGIWSDSIDLSSVRQYIPLAMNINIDPYIVAEGMTYEEMYGERYGDYQIIAGFDEGTESITEEELALALDNFDIKYYILSENSRYKFLLVQRDCVLIGTTNGYEVYRVNNGEF